MTHWHLRARLAVPGSSCAIAGAGAFSPEQQPQDFQAAWCASLPAGAPPNCLKMYPAWRTTRCNRSGCECTTFCSRVVFAASQILGSQESCAISFSLCTVRVRGHSSELPTGLSLEVTGRHGHSHATKKTSKICDEHPSWHQRWLCAALRC